MIENGITLNFATNMISIKAESYEERYFVDIGIRTIATFMKIRADGGKQNCLIVEETLRVYCFKDFMYIGVM